MTLEEMYKQIAIDIQNLDIPFLALTIVRDNIEERRVDGLGAKNQNEITLPEYSTRAGFYKKPLTKDKKKYYSGGYKQFKNSEYGKSNKLFLTGELLGSISLVKISQEQSKLVIVGTMNQTKATELAEKGYYFFDYTNKDIKQIEVFVEISIQSILDKYKNVNLTL